MYQVLGWSLNQSSRKLTKTSLKSHLLKKYNFIFAMKRRVVHMLFLYNYHSPYFSPHYKDTITSIEILGLLVRTPWDVFTVITSTPDYLWWMSCNRDITKDTTCISGKMDWRLCKIESTEKHNSHYTDSTLVRIVALTLNWQMHVLNCSLKAVCTSFARRDYTSQRGHWQVFISSTQLLIIKKKRIMGDQEAPLRPCFYIEGASSYK